ncbi:PEP-CTERM sorting domain-containing protein [Duganella sp. FT135W]|uniref:PEP-CTERM sorting domain-containing protein n=1 Tax=Duganella flavida TaxID=2692175 RepID=A0A6L8KLA9_9BURK|nr:FxDxF family PEP-CTERM protein [Duganella flavida]MYM26592.1 PEP-CTERM sorting domain-containing protein [Duganella flavida]
MQKPSSAIQFLLLAALPFGVATAADFTISGSSSTAQSLANNQTGSITASGALSVSGSTVAVTVTGNNATVSNLGSIKQTGTGRGIRDNTGVTNLVVNNGSATNSTALMQAADADVIQMAKAGATVTLNNYGAMISLNASVGGAQAVDFNAVTGANVVNNYAGGVLKANDADSVRPGLNGVVNNAGTIQSKIVNGKVDDGTDGVDAQTNTGVQIFNLATGLIEGARHGITGGQVDASSSFTMKVNNSAGGVIRGLNGSGLNLDGFNGKQIVTVVNNGTITGQGVTGDGDGVDVDGVVNISNTGIIRSINAYSAPTAGLAYSEGISVGGGTIVNSGTIEGLVSAGNTNAVGRGITLAGNDITSGALKGQREGLYANANVTNQSGGVTRGQSDSAIVVSGVASGNTVTINNNAGASIIGGGASSPAIKGNADNTVIVTAGVINGASSGKAIELGSGVNSVTITGGTINGSINGGGSQSTLVVNGHFAYDGAISNFKKVDVQGGDVTFSGVSSYTGATQLSGGTLTLDGAQRLSADSALILNGGTLRLTSAGADGQAFASLSLSSNSSVLLGGSSLTFGALGTVVNGATLSFTEAASGAYAFRVLGNYSGNADFLQLVGATHINGQNATYSFDGTYTRVAAVPEPATYAMLFAGLALVGVMARRRNKV